jgi:hypothetical protein
MAATIYQNEQWHRAGRFCPVRPPSPPDTKLTLFFSSESGLFKGLARIQAKKILPSRRSCAWRLSRRTGLKKEKTMLTAVWQENVGFSEFIRRRRIQAGVASSQRLPPRP